MLEARISPARGKAAQRDDDRPEELEKGVVSIGSKVSVKDQKSGKSMLYQIVGSAEADPSENKLSNESPVGRRCSATSTGTSSPSWSCAAPTAS